MAVRHFRHHLIGTKFYLRTGHRPLQFLAKTKDLWGKRGRWIMELEEYSFTVEYITSQENVVADALSRIEHEKTLQLEKSEEIGQNNNRANPIAAFGPPKATPLAASIRDDWSMKEFMKAQQRDPLLTEISDIVGMDQVDPRVGMGNHSVLARVFCQSSILRHQK